MRHVVSTLLGATVLCSSFVNPVTAADIAVRPRPVAPVAPVFTWSGFYIGANVGYGWSRTETNTNVVSTLLGFPTDFATSSDHLDGVIGGGQVGFNWQTGPVVFGVEGDFQGSDQRSETTIACGIACAIIENDRVRWFATARGRLGYAVDRFMVYVTGGAAWTNFETNVDVALDGAAANLFSASSTKLGWTVGGGIESGFFWPGWTAKLEYLHIRTDNITVNGTMPDVLGGGTFATDASHRNNIVRAGLNYRF